MTSTQVKEITNADLDNFYGTEHYYQDPSMPGIKYTDGVKFIRDNGLNWFVVDSFVQIYAFKGIGKLDEHDIYSFDIERTGSGDELEEKLVMRDGDLKVIYEGTYDFTTFPEGLDCGMFFQNGVLFLRREY